MGAFIVIFIFITAVTGGDDGPLGKMAAERESEDCGGHIICQ